MWLSESKIRIIKRAAREVWGDKTIVFLFGSGTDDSKKGEQKIDVLVSTRYNHHLPKIETAQLCFRQRHCEDDEGGRGNPSAYRLLHYVRNDGTSGQIVSLRSQ